MNRKFLFALTILIGLLFASGLLSAQASDQDERIDHYEGHTFETEIEAFDALKNKTEDVAKILSAETLDDQKMEQIHEISYIMEDAVAKIKNSASFDFSKLSENLETLHLASEDHEAEKLRNAFKAYSTEFEEFKSTFKTQ